MSDDERADDVPSSIDLRDPADAAAWVAQADAKRPWRTEIRAAIAERLRSATPPVRRLLELGPGPGLLAEVVLATCALDRYTLFDFSPPMLDMCRERVGAHPAIELVLGDFTRPGWTQVLVPPYDAVVTMQAVHEIRHKRHVPRLYREVRELLPPGGLLLVCDHEPPDDSARATALHATEAEQHAALAGAGFVRVATHSVTRGLYICTAAAS